jgi:uncharacterized Zn-finger protein
MADHGTPHFHNSMGLAKIEIGSRQFMCMGALPPYDHPHVFINMGDGNEAVCPYCSTLYLYSPSLHAGASNPAEAQWQGQAA